MYTSALSGSHRTPHGLRSLDMASTKTTRKYGGLCTNTESIDSTKIGNEGNFKMLQTTPRAAMEIESGLQPAWIRLQTEVLLAITRMRSLSAKHPVQERLMNALRTRKANISHRSNLENILQRIRDKP